MSSPNEPNLSQPIPPFQQAPPPYQQAPPKKGRSKLLVGCGVVAILLVVCIAAIAVVNIVNGGGGKATATIAAANPSGGTVVGASNPSARGVPTGSAASTKPTASSAPAGASAPTATGTSAKPVATVQAFKKGETATLDGQRVTLNEATRKGNVFVADVTVENTGTKQINVSSLISFDARGALGNQGSFSLTESQGLDGTVDPGSKLRGTIGYEFAVDAKGVKLYYSPALFTGQPTVFALDDAATAQPFPPNPIAAQAKPLDSKATYKVGDTVKVGDLVLKLENVSVQGTLITADLVAYNAGGKAVSLSSLASFSGQDSTGKQGDFKLPDKSSFDGTLLPGDSLRGQVRLEFDAGSTGHTLTYRSSVFGGQAVKWALD